MSDGLLITMVICGTVVILSLIGTFGKNEDKGE